MELLQSQTLTDTIKDLELKIETHHNTFAFYLQLKKVNGIY
jgi:hypothetical protein